MMSSFSRLVHDDDSSARAPTVLSREQPQQQSSRMKALLYVWGQHEKNSANALNIAKQSGAIDFVTIIDVRNLRVAEIPDWMSGVPIVLIADDTGEDATVFKGTAALQKIQDISQFSDEFEPVVFEEPVAPAAPPVQHIDGIGAMPTRQITMPRGIDEQGPPSQQQQQEPQHFDPSISEEKVSAQDMQVQIEEILKRREAMMQEAQQSGGGGGAPLPSMSASS